MPHKSNLNQFNCSSTEQNMSKFVVPERIKKAIENERKRPNYLYEDIAICNEKLDREEEAVDQFVEEVYTAISSKNHDIVVHWFSSCLLAEAERRQATSTESTTIYAPNNDRFIAALKDDQGIPSLLKFLSLQSYSLVMYYFRGHTTTTWVICLFRNGKM